MNSLNNQKGGVTALTLSLLPVLLAVLIGFFYVTEALTFKEKARHLCRQQLSEAQSEIKKSTENLLKLNPLAKALDIKEKVVLAQLAAAVVALRWEQIPRLTVELNKINRKQKILDKQQKAILAYSRLQTNRALAKLRRELNALSSSFNATVLKAQIDSRWSTHAGVVLIPKTKRTAPEYEYPKDFESKQELDQKWKYSLQIVSPLTKFLSYSQEFNDQCKVTLFKKNQNNLYVKIKMGKYL